MHSQLRWWIIVMPLVLVACATLGVPGTLQATEPSPTASPRSPLITTPAGKTVVIEQAISDLAARLNISPAAINLVSQESTVWPNAGLGCPQPGIDYPEVQVDGLRIILGHTGTFYEYHAGPTRVVLCEKDGIKTGLTAVPLAPIEPTEEINVTTTLTIEPGMQSLIDAATADLLKRLAVTPDTIEVVSARSTVWPDKSLGCPQAGIQYLQVPVDGFRIELRVNNQLYAYHGGGGRGPFLCESPFK